MLALHDATNAREFPPLGVYRRCRPIERGKALQKRSAKGNELREREQPGVVGYATALTTLENDCRVLGGCCEVHFDSTGARVGTIKP